MIMLREKFDDFLETKKIKFPIIPQFVGVNFEVARWFTTFMNRRYMHHVYCGRGTIWHDIFTEKGGCEYHKPVKNWKVEVAPALEKINEEN